MGPSSRTLTRTLALTLILTVHLLEYTCTPAGPTLRSFSSNMMPRGVSSAT